ncbi:MAG: CDP-alcohol phosphatidyltransferase family protein [Proteobacteria bacterium]|nr:CDP-alcohol phosphatidyltransferase family protein [Pseudomonadota bacterium]
MRHIPNIICLLRIVLIIPVLQALQAGHYLLSLALCILAAASDLLDGYLAKHFGWSSALGRFLDPLADKLLVVALYIASAWLGIVPWWLTAAVVARDVMIGLGALTYRLWFGPLHGRPTRISKFNTGAQLVFIMLVLLGHGIGFPPQEVLAASAIVVLVSTILSGWDYLSTFTRRAWYAPAKAA